jgi:hypothetical protein
VADECFEERRTQLDRSAPTRRELWDRCTNRMSFAADYVVDVQFRLLETWIDENGDGVVDVHASIGWDGENPMLVHAPESVPPG